MFESINVYNEPLAACCTDPLTGFYRDSFCNTSHEDRGIHTVCVQITTEFLKYSKSQGNDLSSDQPNFGFKGLKEGQKWCLCAGRWLEAHHAGFAPNVYLNSTHIETLSIIPLTLLEDYRCE